MATELNSRERVLRFLRKEKVDRIPCFTGMGNVLVEEVDRLGWHFGDLHRDPYKMGMWEWQQRLHTKPLGLSVP